MDAHLTLGNWLAAGARPGGRHRRLQGGALPQARRRDRARQPRAAVPRARPHRRTSWTRWRCSAARCARTRRTRSPGTSWRRSTSTPSRLGRRGRPPSRTRWPRTRRWAPPTTGWAWSPSRAATWRTAETLVRQGPGAGARPAHRALQPRPHPRGARRRAPGARRSTARSSRPIPTTGARGSTSPSSAARRGDREGYLAELRDGRREGARLRRALLVPGPRGAGGRPPRRRRGTWPSRGLEPPSPSPRWRRSGHYVLADVYNRQGQRRPRKRGSRRPGGWKEQRTGRVPSPPLIRQNGPI